MYPRSVWILLGTIQVIGILLTISWKTQSTGIYLLTIGIGCALALFTVSQTTHQPTIFTVDTYADKREVLLRGVIVEEPDRRPLKTNYTVATESIMLMHTGSLTLNVKGRTLVTDRDGWPQYKYGDRISVRGILEKPGQIEDFSYERYLSRFDVHSVMYRGDVVQRENGHGFWMFEALLALKNRFEEQINRIEPEPHASFLAGLLTGSRRGIPEHLLEDFRRTGLTHIIAISGYNITIIISIIAGLLFWLPMKKRLLPAIAAIAIFTIFVGAGASVVRAAIMGILGLCALQLGRQSNTRLIILWTAFFMLLFNPKQLWYDAGFQLSFLAVIGLTELGPLLKKWTSRLPTVLGIREALQMTLAAQIAAVPLILLLFGELSLVAPLANILVIPAIPIAMLFGFTGTIISFIFFPLGQIFAYIAWGCLQWIIFVAESLARFPYASIHLSSVTPIMILIYYCLIIAWIIHHHMITIHKEKVSCRSFLRDEQQ
jgi:competence protein ComEC